MTVVYGFINVLMLREKCERYALLTCGDLDLNSRGDYLIEDIMVSDCLLLLV